MLIEKLLNARRVQNAPHSPGGIGNEPLGRRDGLIACDPVANAVKSICSPAATYLDQEEMTASIKDFRQSQVEAGCRFGAGIHGGAKTVPPGLRAVHGNPKGLLPPSSIDRVEMLFLQEDFVLNGDGMQLAWPNTYKGIRWWVFCRQDGLQALARLDDAEKLDIRWMQELLPGIHSNVIAEECTIPSIEQAAFSPALFVAHSVRQIIH